MKQIILIISSVLILVSCKSKQNNNAINTDQERAIITNEENKENKVTPSPSEDDKAIKEKSEIKNLADAHYSIFPEFNTLEIKADVTYKSKHEDLSPSADIKIDKNKQILITIKMFGIPGAKIYLTPERVSYYEILNGTHYEGNYQLIEKYLGTKLNYENVENLLLGKAFYNINTNNYTKTKNNELELKLNQFLMRLVFGSKNEIASTEITQAKSADKLTIQYPSYQRSENIYIPKVINIHAMHKDQVQINIDYRKVIVNPALDFRFKIPNNSKPIKI